MPDPLGAFTYPIIDGGASYGGGGYVYPTGYAQLSDVTHRISAGSWDPVNDPSAYPTVDMVNGWLIDATAAIDAALATRGYFVPLEPDVGFDIPDGMQMLNGVAVQVWLLLRNVAAAYACHYVEASRHGGVGGASEDPNAAHWMEIYDDFCTRLESGADNLVVFGVGGPFPPDPNAANAADSGSLGFVQLVPSIQQGPMFSRWENLGSGWETISDSQSPR